MLAIIGFLFVALTRRVVFLNYFVVRFFFRVFTGNTGISVPVPVPHVIRILEPGMPLCLLCCGPPGWIDLREREGEREREREEERGREEERER
jgi:hypothetical protein